MMEVDFFILTGTDPEMRLRHACRLTEHAYNQGEKVHVRVDDAELAKRFDGLLWSFSDLSFIPHAVDPPDAGAWPVTVGSAAGDPEATGCLINLAGSLPPEYERFAYIAEIVDDNGKDAARQRYRAYREKGARLTHHNPQQEHPSGA
jgi:DNA polymerase III subunit chi